MNKKQNEPELKPEYIRKLRKIRKGNFIKFHSVEELKKSIEDDNKVG